MYSMPIEVMLRINDPEIALSANTKELLLLLQDIADEWFEQQVPTIPCGYVPKTSRIFNAKNYSN